MSMVARSLRHLTTGDLRSQMDTLCHLHTVHEVSADIKAPPTLCHDPLRLKALCLLAFPQQVMFGRAEAVCGVPGVESAAQEELAVMKENDFDPSQSLTMW